MMKKTKIGAAVLMAAFAMMTVQPMTSMAAGNCQTWICGGKRTAANQEAGFRIQRPAEAVRKTGIPVSEIGVLAAGSNRRQPMNRSLLSRYKNIHCYCLYNPYPA